jgi:hypothetical protein
VFGIAGETMGIGSGFGSSRIFNPRWRAVVRLTARCLPHRHVVFLIVTPITLFWQPWRTVYIAPLLGEGIPAPRTSDATDGAMIVPGADGPANILCPLIDGLTLGLLARVAPQVQVFLPGCR